ncbi:MAG: ATP-binding cassette domain-containing protein [Bacteroidota bacterium]|nr:ATP-binding cassette domain-containing protein [Bacteroidota bacterium]
MVGITGISGKGKTTLINIILGFLSPDSGTIYMNGQAAGGELRRHYWSRISYIKQQHFFLHASIAENITLQEKGYDNKRHEQIQEITAKHKSIGRFPIALDTLITENGKNFSGGQRQRFILARALYKDFDLLILDEPFSELDNSAEIDLLRKLQELTVKGKIVLLITHNKEALCYCNKKILMDEY